MSRYLASLHPQIASIVSNYVSLVDSPHSELNKLTAYRAKLGHSVSG